MDYKSSFLTKNIITYLGNKRKLLVFINDSIEQIIVSDPELSKKEKSQINVFDIFSGSGIVARSLKQHGYKVYCNDLEVYTKAINSTFINTNEEDLPDIFNGIYKNLLEYYQKNNITHKESNVVNDEYLRVIELLNSVRDLGDKQTKPYFSIYYAPKDTQNPNFHTERLFYTQENGKFIDSVLEAIFEFKDSLNQPIFNDRARNIILSSLFNRMTTNINTSGTMKGFHDGWGGKGKNALERILGDMNLERIELLSDTPRGQFFNDYAENIFVKHPELKVDIIYADPPYNQHQYSANYHMLTTAMNNRDYEISATLSKGERAGIRKDHNRSDFSKGKKSQKIENGKLVSDAYIAFDKFIKTTMNNTKYIVISYNQEGVLGQEDLVDILSQGGKNHVEVKIKKHEKYKGGKKTNISNYVIEYLFVVKTNTAQTIEDIAKVKDLTHVNTKITLLTDKFINLKKINNSQDTTFISVEKKSDNSYIVDFGSNKTIDVGSDFKINNINIEDLDIDTILAIESLCYGDFEKSELINDYIENSKYLDAISALYSFKIDKYKETCLEIIKILETKPLNSKELGELSKIKDYMAS